MGPESWRHVPTEHNPADVASRSCKVSQLKLVGRSLLPKEGHRVTAITGVLTTDEGLVLEELINPSDVSDFQKLLRVPGYVLRFVQNTRRRQTQDGQTSFLLDQEELYKVETLWITCIQKHVREEKSGGKTAPRPLALFNMLSRDLASKTSHNELGHQGQS